ncbi:MAG: carbohydrate ABC transporter substrate-binding protein, partial [Pseudomonadota bacterium]|nr:carbohydrate ABC transporter substrate-binding protein [Pseudomonadota bacterium]
WAEVAALAAECRGTTSQVAIPLNANHAYCAFLSVGISLAGAEFWPAGGDVHPEAAAEALRFLHDLAPQLHDSSRVDDPIGISDRMADTDEILYVPLMFGYSNYARAGFRKHRLRFGNAPSGAGGAIGSVLGGVGLALSSRSRKPDAAADLAREIASPATQCGVYVRSGGQPGHAAAWGSPEANALTGGFFRSTRRTMDEAFLRPRVPGHRAFQPQAGALVHACIWTDALPVSECLAGYRRLVETLLQGN